MLAILNVIILKTSQTVKIIMNILLQRNTYFIYQINYNVQTVIKTT